VAGGLVDRHIAFIEALRGAGLAVSLAEDLDAVAALSALGWHDRETVRAAYASTLVKRQVQRPVYDTLFDLYFPRLLGDGVRAVDGEEGSEEEFRDALAEALTAGEDPQLAQLATEAVGRYGRLEVREKGQSAWSAYTTVRQVAPEALTQRIVAALRQDRTEREARRDAARRIGRFTRLVEQEALRRIAEDKGPERLAKVAVRPSVDQLAFLAASGADLVEMRREVQLLARRLATRLTKEHHANRRGPLDFRRTIRASMSTGGVPLATRHRPKRPNRSELVVLCDVSGSVANFAGFTLLLVHVLREQFTKIRAFTFVDEVHEVTDALRPGRDEGEVLTELAARARHAALWGSTDYGRVFEKFHRRHADALGPRTVLLILGDARTNNLNRNADRLAELVRMARKAFWLNPERRGDWGTGDSVAPAYADIVEMVECRNLAQLGAFVHDVAL
jgi:uncharacterized protein